MGMLQFIQKSCTKTRLNDVSGWITVGGQIGDDVSAKCMAEAWKHGVNYFDSKAFEM